MIRTYSELLTIESFEGRFSYLRLDGKVGRETFGSRRFKNQRFYTSSEWSNARDFVITRDFGCDLAISDREIISDRIYVHHMNPITEEDLIHSTEFLLDPEYLITVSFDTHNAIHYGDETILVSSTPISRKPNDTCPWK